MGNFLSYICSDTEFLQILNQIKIIESQFYQINRNTKISVQLEEKFENLILRLKDPKDKDINRILMESKDVLRKLRRVKTSGIPELEKNIKNLYIFIGEFITNKDIRKKQKEIKFLKELELKLLNECTELMKEYKDGMDSNIKDPFMEEINSELIDFQEYLNNMKKLKTKSFYNEIANSIKTIDKTNLSNNVSSKFLKSIDKKLSGYPSEEKKGFKPIQNIENSFRKKMKQNEQKNLFQNEQKNLFQNEQKNLFQSQKNSQKKNNLYMDILKNLKSSEKLVKKNDRTEQLLSKVLNFNDKIRQNSNSFKLKNNISNQFEISEVPFNRGKKGDFKWEISEKIDPKTIYLYTDDDENYIETYDRDNIYPRSFGLSIGEDDKLTVFTKNKINKDIERLEDILKRGNYKKIKFNFEDIDERIKKFFISKINLLSS